MRAYTVIVAAGCFASAFAHAQPASPGPFADVAARFPECAALADSYRQLDSDLRAAAVARPRSAVVVNRLTTSRSEMLAALTACTRQGTRERADWRLDAAGLRSVADSADGRSIVAADAQRRVWIWDAATGRASSWELERPPLAATPTPAGDRIFVAYQSSAELRDVRTREILVAYEVLGSPAPVLSADGATLLARSRKNGAPLVLLDTASGRELRRFEIDGALRALAFSADGRKVYAATTQGAAAVWDLADEARAVRWTTATGAQEAAALAPNGAFVVSATNASPIEIRATADGRLLRSMPTGRFQQSASALSVDPTGTLLLSGHRDGKVRVWNVAEGVPVRELDAGAAIEAATFSRDGRLLFAGGTNSATRIWETASGTELVQLVAMRDGSWSVIDAAGRYDAPAGAAPDGLRLMIRRQSVDLSQVKDTLWDPGLLAKRLGWSAEPLRPIADIAALEPSPRIEVDAPAGAGMATLRLTDQGGGIGAVRVLVNGKEVDIAGAPVPAAGGATVAVNLASAAIRPGEINTLEAAVWNRAGDLASRGTTVTWLAPGERPAALPELYAIVIGISEFADPSMRLRFPAADAAGIAAAIGSGASRLLGAERVHLTLLTSDSAQRPDKARIRAAFETAEHARPDDILFVYLAGHGVVSAADTYAYLTADAKSLFDVDPGAAVTSTELVEWIKRSKALKQVMVLDTCAAGAIQNELVSARGVPGDQIRAIERLQSRTGFHVLMGSAADRLSYEATQFGRGLLTYALLQGLYGAALREGEFIDVSRWFQYAVDEVPTLARRLGGVQQPLVAAPGGSSFDIGRLTAADRAAIPVPAERPLVLRPVFLDPQQGFDHLELMSAVREQLLAESAPGARGPEPPRSAVYVDADELPGAIRLSGTYSVTGDAVAVTVNLVRDSERVASYEVAGRRTDRAALAAAVTAQAQRAMRALPIAPRP